MLLSFGFLILEAAFGILIFDFFDPERRFGVAVRTIASIATGLLLSSFIILILSLALGSLTPAIWVFILILAALFFARFKSLVYFVKFGARNWSSSCPKNFLRPWFFLLAALLIGYVILLSTVLFRGADGNLKGVEVGWGDVALHLSLIERLSVAEPFVLEHPILAGANLKYPFLINFSSAIFRKLGADRVLSFRLPLYVFGLSSLLLIFFLARVVLKSKTKAVLALALIVLGSGLGFLVFFKDTSQSYQSDSVNGIISVFRNPPHEYTHLDNRTGGKPQAKDTADNIVWIVPAISFLSHQRSFSVGLTIFSLALLGLYYYGRDKKFWRFGLLAGLLPFSHGHTFLALFLVLGVLFWFYLVNWKTWLKFFLLTALIALPQINYLGLVESSANGVLFRPYFGWLTCEHTDSWFFCDPKTGTDVYAAAFWSKNFGIIFFLWLAALAIVLAANLGVKRLESGASRFSFKFLLASLVIFLTGNFLLLQPWPFDNNKLLFYWWFLAVIFAVVPVISFFFERRAYLWKVLTALLIIFALFAGVFDFTYRVFKSRASGYFGYADGSPTDQEFSSWIKTNTPPNALFLTAPNVDPPPLFLAGRPIYLGYEGWLWTHGLSYGRNRETAEKIFAGEVALACAEKIDYILLDEASRRHFPNIDETSILDGTEIVFRQTPLTQERLLLKPKCD